MIARNRSPGWCSPTLIDSLNPSGTTDCTIHNRNPSVRWQTSGSGEVEYILGLIYEAVDVLGSDPFVFLDRYCRVIRRSKSHTLCPKKIGMRSMRWSVSLITRLAVDKDHCNMLLSC